MEDYWKTHNSPTATHLSAFTPSSTAVVTVPGLKGSHSDAATMESEFDQHCCMLLSKATLDHDAGWAEELWRYLKVIPDVSKDMDIVHWWSVRAWAFVLYIQLILLSETCFNISYTCKDCHGRLRNSCVISSM